MKKLPKELIRIAIEEKRLADEMGALNDKIAPALDAFMREKYKDDPEKLAEWEAEWQLIRPPTPPRPRAKRAELPKKADD
jgi:hypothetical protein